MNRKKYLEMRNKLLAEAEALVEEGKFEDSKAKEEEIKVLDEKWDNIKTAKANLNALKDVEVGRDIENESLNLKDGEVVDFQNMSEEDLLKTEEYKNAFFKKLQGKSITEQENALVTASGAIPTETMNKIVEKMEYIAPILAKIDLSFIPSNISIPVEDTVNDASWVAMGTASTDSADELDTVDLAAYKLIKTVEIGADSAVMSIPAFETWITNKLSKKMAKALENAIINGTGSSQPKGLLASGVITNTGTFTMAGMTYADLLAIIADLPDHGYRTGASLVMPSGLFYSDVLPALTDKGSGLDVQAASKMNVLGYDVVLCDRVADDTLIFGNLENYAMNFAQNVTIESDKSVGFRKGSTVYRAMALVDGKPVNTDAFNVYERAAS